MSSSPWDAGYGTGFGAGSPTGVTVTGWPTVTDVENWLRTTGQPVRNLRAQRSRKTAKVS